MLGTARHTSPSSFAVSIGAYAEALKSSASILAHDYGAEITKQEEEHLSTLAHTLTGEWNPERSLGYSAEMLAKRASELYHACLIVGFHLGR